jgi:hypothetical protein
MVKQGREVFVEIAKHARNIYELHVQLTVECSTRSLCAES